MPRFYCPQPVLTLMIRKRKGETERQYGKRFEQFMVRLNRILNMRIKIDEANERLTLDESSYIRSNEERSDDTSNQML